VGVEALLNVLSQVASLLAAAAALGGFLGHARLAYLRGAGGRVTPGDGSRRVVRNSGYRYRCFVCNRARIDSVTEGKALILIIAVSMVFTFLLTAGLMALKASPAAIFIAFVALIAVTVNGTSSVILHYGKKRRDR
jgi:hypothetical protein